MVFPESPGSGGRFLGSTNWGAVAQVVSQPSLDDCFSRLCEEEQETKNPEMIKMYKFLKRIFSVFSFYQPLISYYKSSVGDFLSSDKRFCRQNPNNAIRKVFLNDS
jgi:hypothetical protein